MPRSDARAGHTATDRGVRIEIPGLLILLGALDLGYVALTNLHGDLQKVALGAAFAISGIDSLRGT